MHENILEAHRYLDNARTLLSEKAKKRDGRYEDDKYVRLAGHAAYSGVLEALDAVLEGTVRNRKNVKWYRDKLAKRDTSSGPLQAARENPEDR